MMTDLLLRLTMVATCAALTASCEDMFAPSDPEPEPPVEDPSPEPEPEPDDPAPDDDFLQDENGRTFSYVPVGDLLPQSGPGHTDTTIYRPDMLFPLEDAAFLRR